MSKTTLIRSNAAITLRDVAVAAKVSKTTVGYVLNNTPNFSVSEDTRRRVHDAAARLGYRRNALAAALNQGRIHTVGVVLPLRYLAEDAMPELGQVYAKDALVAIADAARRDGLRITLTPYDEEAPNQADALQELTDGRVDGLILISLRSDAFARALYQTGFPCVSIGSGYAERPIRLDNVGGGAAMAQHLLSLGHKHMVWCNGRVDGRQKEIESERELGFMRTLREAGIFGSRIALAADYPDELQACLALPQEIRPTALAAFNDWYAYQAVQIARHCGRRVPDDLSVVGFDDNLLALACDPPLTTVHNPLRKLAAEAIAVLHTLWTKEGPHLISPRPCRRNSSFVRPPQPPLVTPLFSRHCR